MKRFASLCLLLMVAACARDSAASPSLAEQSLVTVAITEDGVPKRLVAGTEVGLRVVDRDRLIATAGCNTMSGTARLDVGQLVVSDLATTEMGCAPELHAQDEWLALFLQSAPRWQPTDNGVTLSTATIEMRLTSRDTTPPTP